MKCHRTPWRPFVWECTPVPRTAVYASTRTVVCASTPNCGVCLYPELRWMPTIPPPRTAGYAGKNSAAWPWCLFLLISRSVRVRDQSCHLNWKVACHAEYPAVSVSSKLLSRTPPEAPPPNQCDRCLTWRQPFRGIVFPHVLNRHPASYCLSSTRHNHVQPRF
jgi:hypothetical protein